MTTLRPRLTRLLALTGLAVVLATAAIGAPGGGGGAAAGSDDDSPEKVAVRHYRAGLRARDKAWRYEKKAARSKDAATAERFRSEAHEQFVAAAESQRRAIEVAPEMYQAHASLGYALRRAGRFEESIAAYDRALEIEPRYGEAVEYRGEAYLALGRLDEAKQAYDDLAEVPDLAAELLDAMEAWVAERRATPGEIPTADVEALARWIDEQRPRPAAAGEPSAARDVGRW